jgi:putative transcriptional regulator
MKAFDRIREGLEQAINHAAGQSVDVVMHYPVVPDVKLIRQKTGLTQEQFASRCHISVNTLRHWERGDRQPHGPATALLQLVEHNPQFVMETLAGKTPLNALG